MIDNRMLHKEFGLLERQVSQVCQVVDKKVFMLNEELSVLKAMLEIVSERLTKLENPVVEVKDEQ
jgi:hypothetical protein